MQMRNKRALMRDMEMSSAKISEILADLESSTSMQDCATKNGKF